MDAGLSGNPNFSITVRDTCSAIFQEITTALNTLNHNDQNIFERGSLTTSAENFAGYHLPEGMVWYSQYELSSMSSSVHKHSIPSSGLPCVSDMLTNLDFAMARGWLFDEWEVELQVRTVGR